MNDFFKKYLFIIVLLAVMIAWAIFSLLGHGGVPVHGTLPPINAANLCLLLVIGLIAGLLGGMIGTGGCSVMLPAIHFWMGYPAPVAVGTTLFAVIFTAVSGGYGHLVRKNLDYRATLWLGLLGILGVVLGSWLFTLLLKETALLGVILGIVFLWPAVRMIIEGINVRRNGKAGPEEQVVPGSEGGLGVFGFIVGILTGVVGLGGGYALVPGLIYLFGAPVYITMGTSLAVMIPLAVVGGVIKLVQGYVALSAGLLLATGTIVGAQFGAAVMKKISPNILKLIFGVYFLYVSLKFILGYFGIAIW